MKIDELLEDVSNYAKALKEFEEAVAKYKKQYPSYRADNESLKKTLALFKAKKFKAAEEEIAKADTIVRDVVPTSACKFMWGDEDLDEAALVKAILPKVDKNKEREDTIKDVKKKRDAAGKNAEKTTFKKTVTLTETPLSDDGKVTVYVIEDEPGVIEVQLIIKATGKMNVNKVVKDNEAWINKRLAKHKIELKDADHYQDQEENHGTVRHYIFK